MTQGGGSEYIGILAPGHYTVNANMYMIPWGGSTPYPYASGSTSFDVAAIPEPGILYMLISCGVAFIHRKSRVGKEGNS